MSYLGARLAMVVLAGCGSIQPISAWVLADTDSAHILMMEIGEAHLTRQQNYLDAAKDAGALCLAEITARLDPDIRIGNQRILTSLDENTLACSMNPASKEAVDVAEAVLETRAAFEESQYEYRHARTTYGLKKQNQNTRVVLWTSFFALLGYLAPSVLKRRT